MTSSVPNVPVSSSTFTLADWYSLEPERRSFPLEGILQTLSDADPPNPASTVAPVSLAAAAMASTVVPEGDSLASDAGGSAPSTASASLELTSRPSASTSGGAANPVIDLGGAASSPSLPAPPQGAVAPGGRLLVQWTAGASESDRAMALAALGAVRRELIHTSPMKARGEGVMEVIQLPAGVSVDAAIATYAANPGVRFAEVDQLLQTQAISNDPEYQYGQLWGMYGSDSPTPVGPPGTTNAFGSNAEAAWNQGFTGSKSVIVGILDEGIDIEHEDLAANIWLNPFEVDDGVDNDGNGYVDDIHGWNFFNNNNSLFDRYYDDHGTHVAGTIGAVGGNGVGVAGVNWDVSMIPAKFLGPSGGYISGAILAMDYVTDLKWRHGLNIVATNNSWIGGGNSQAMKEAIVRSARQDILFVVSAGNQSSNNDLLPKYPSGFNTTAELGFDAVISVAAIDDYGQLAGFSNYGKTTVDLGAPGFDILSTMPWDSYDLLSGTSMATPHVTGAVALYASRYPGSTAEQIRAALMASTIPTPSLVATTVSGGRLDVMNFLNTVVPPSISITAAQPHLAEGQAGSATAFQFTLTRHGTTSGQTTVSWSVGGSGSAPANADDFVGQVLPSGTVTFAAGETNKTISVSVKPDTLQESSESFTVSLNNPSGGATLASGRQSASASILNDDGVILAFDASAITIPSIGAALPFSSRLTVASGSADPISDVEVTLYNFYHNSLDDVDILLVGPTGAKTFLMSDAGGSNSVDGITLTFSNLAAAPVPDSDPLSSGRWRPMNYFNEDDFGTPNNDLFDAPAPPGPYVADLSVFNGTNPDGVWSLYVKDDASDAAGKIMAGWSLSIKTQPLRATVSLAVTPDRVMEDGLANLVYTFTRSGPINNPLSVNYTVAGTATPDIDYTGIPLAGSSKTLTFAAGASTATVIVDPRADTEVEASDTVSLTLLEGTGYIIGTEGAVVGTIQDDDTQIMEGSGGTSLLRDSSNRLYAQPPNGAPVGLKFRNRAILQTSFPGWEPLAAETFSGVNQMIWRNTQGNYLSLWTMDSSWNWVSSTGEWGMNSAGALLQETRFGMDFNGNGIIGSGLPQTSPVPVL